MKLEAKGKPEFLISGEVAVEGERRLACGDGQLSLYTFLDDYLS